MAAPLFDKCGRVHASIAISSPTDRFNRLRRELTSAALQVATGINEGRFDGPVGPEYDFFPVPG